MATISKRPLAVFVVKRYRKMADFILKQRTLVLNIGSNATIFVTPAPPLATVTTDVDNLEAAEALAKTRAQGAVAARNTQYEVALDDLDTMLAYVQGLANAAPNRTAAIEIIEAAGFNVKEHGAFKRPPLDARNGNVSGTVELRAQGAKAARASHEWQSSANGTSAWVNYPSTLKAETEISGFAKLATVYFRHRVILKTGPDPWGPVVSIVIL